MEADCQGQVALSPSSLARTRSGSFDGTSTGVSKQVTDSSDFASYEETVSLEGSVADEKENEGMAHWRFYSRVRGQTRSPIGRGHRRSSAGQRSWRISTGRGTSGTTARWASTARDESTSTPGRIGDSGETKARGAGDFRRFVSPSAHRTSLTATPEQRWGVAALCQRRVCLSRRVSYRRWLLPCPSGVAGCREQCAG